MSQPQLDDVDDAALMAAFPLTQCSRTSLRHPVQTRFDDEAIPMDETIGPGPAALVRRVPLRLAAEAVGVAGNASALPQQQQQHQQQQLYQPIPPSPTSVSCTDCASLTDSMASLPPTPRFHVPDTPRGGGHKRGPTGGPATSAKRCLIAGPVVSDPLDAAGGDGAGEAVVVARPAALLSAVHPMGFDAPATPVAAAAAAAAGLGDGSAGSAPQAVPCPPAPCSPIIAAGSAPSDSGGGGGGGDPAAGCLCAADAAPQGPSASPSPGAVPAVAAPAAAPESGTGPRPASASDVDDAALLAALDMPVDDPQSLPSSAPVPSPAAAAAGPPPGPGPAPRAEPAPHGAGLYDEEADALDWALVDALVASAAGTPSTPVPAPAPTPAPAALPAASPYWPVPPQQPPPPPPCVASGDGADPVQAAVRSGDDGGAGDDDDAWLCAIDEAVLGTVPGPCPATPGAVVAPAADADDGPDGGDPALQLTDEQRRVVEAVLQGESVFFTGCAGTGKSHVLRALIARLPAASTAVTATTGVAACALGGITLHRFAGIGHGSDPLPRLVQMAGRGRTGSLWNSTRVLIIDEVSMLSAELFDQLEYIARKVRRNERPFGGIQLVLCGDFFQLPPVGRERKPRFCFQAASWQRCIRRMFELHAVFRQSDPTFVQLLDEVRRGTLSPGGRALLQAAQRNVVRRDDGIEPTVLTPYLSDVDKVNDAKLAAIRAPPVVYQARDSGAEAFLSVLQQNCPARAVLTLKVGAQVVLLRNIAPRQGLVNGARGVVVGFAPAIQSCDACYPLVQFASGVRRVIERRHGRFTLVSGGRDVAVRLQVPLALGWALSVHKCQGMTLDRVELSIARAFEPGMAYVALSRARTLQNLRLIGFDDPLLPPPAPVVEFYAQLHRLAHPAPDSDEDRAAEGPAVSHSEREQQNASDAGDAGGRWRKG